MRGQTIDVSGAELARLEASGALVKEPVEVVGPIVDPAPPVALEDAGKLLEPPAKPSRAASKADDGK